MDNTNTQNNDFIAKPLESRDGKPPRIWVSPDRDRFEVSFFQNNQPVGIKLNFLMSFTRIDQLVAYKEKMIAEAKAAGKPEPHGFYLNFAQSNKSENTTVPWAQLPSVVMPQNAYVPGSNKAAANISNVNNTAIQQLQQNQAALTNGLLGIQNTLNAFIAANNPAPAAPVETEEKPAEVPATVDGKETNLDQYADQGSDAKPEGNSKKKK